MEYAAIPAGDMPTLSSKEISMKSIAEFTSQPMNHQKILSNILVTCVQRIYAPTWLSIKRDSCCMSGAKHLFMYPLFTDAHTCHSLYTIVQRNGSFAHHENVLLAMIDDANPMMKQLASCRILQARRKVAPRVREFKVPIFNFEATTYYQMINWNMTYNPRTSLKMLRMKNSDPDGRTS